MALAVNDFTQPEGELEESYFPSVDLTAYLGTWLSQAQSKAASDEEAQEAYVYHRAFQHIADRFNNEAADLDVEDVGSRRRLVEQMRFWQRRAAEQLRAFEEATASDDEGSFAIMRSRR